LSWRTASRTAAGMSAISRMRWRHLVMGAMASSWSLTSCRRPMFLPMLPLGICPAIIRTGDEAEYAVLSPEAAFKSPGPGPRRPSRSRPRRPRARSRRP
jgi:hypothetical protein